MSDRDLDMDLIRGNLIATRSILAAMLAHIGKVNGEDALVEIPTIAREMVARADHRMRSEAESLSDTDTAKEVSSCADGFLDTAFDQAFDSLG